MTARRGVLWITDYIAETQFRFTPKRIEIVNRVLGILPESFGTDRVNQRTIDYIERRDPGNLISPFEPIRSAEIAPIFPERFDVIEKREFDCIVGLVCPVGTRHRFLEKEESRALFELLFLLDEILLEENILPPRRGAYLLRPKNKSV